MSGKLRDVLNKLPGHTWLFFSPVMGTLIFMSAADACCPLQLSHDYYYLCWCSMSATSVLSSLIMRPIIIYLLTSQSHIESLKRFIFWALQLASRLKKIIQQLSRSIIYSTPFFSHNSCQHRTIRHSSKWYCWRALALRSRSYSQGRRENPPVYAFANRSNGNICLQMMQPSKRENHVPHDPPLPSSICRVRPTNHLWEKVSCSFALQMK